MTCHIDEDWNLAVKSAQTIGPLLEKTVVQLRHECFKHFGIGLSFQTRFDAVNGKFLLL